MDTRRLMRLTKVVWDSHEPVSRGALPTKTPSGWAGIEPWDKFCDPLALGLPKHRGKAIGAGQPPTTPTPPLLSCNILY
jgi:hypothetical protein